MQLRQAQADREALTEMSGFESFEQAVDMLNLLAHHSQVNEYCGLPVPIKGERLVLEPRHPAYAAYQQIDSEGMLDYGYSCSNEDVNEETALVNCFYSHRHRCDIVIYKVGNKIEWGKLPALNHVTHDFATMACSVAWKVDAEIQAMETLRGMLEPHIFKMYFLSGMFIETSKRSGVTYIFRRLRPTVALRPDEKNNSMRILACLCLHPIGYYADTWAGALCPTDDVMSHLLLMRGDEPMFWKRANHIRPHRPEAGL